MKVLLNLILISGMSILMFSCKEKAATAGEKGEVATTGGVQYNAALDMTTINWEGSKPTGDKHTGTINISDGQLFVSNGKFTSGGFNLDMNTIVVTDITGDDKADLEAHLKGTEADGADHFFNVTKFPAGKFEITSVTDTTGENGLNALVKGNLTLKGITKEITIPANVAVTEAGVTVSTPSFAINRTEWGVNYKSKSIFSDLGDKFINDDIVLKINLTATPAAAPVQ